jgi:hypothetical protein
MLGLSAGSPFPGRSLTAHWGSAASSPATREMTTPAFTEQVDSTAFQAHPPRGFAFGAFQMSLVADGQHYIRNGQDAERLFDLTADPFELDDMMRRPDAGQRVQVFRKRLLDFLNDNRASTEVETAYLKFFRERLEAAVRITGPKIATSP